MMDYKRIKTYLVSLFLVIYYAGALPFSGMWGSLLKREDTWFIADNAMIGIGICAAVTIFHEIYLYITKKRKNVILGLIQYLLNHLLVIIFIGLSITVYIYRADVSERLLIARYLMIIVALYDTDMEKEMKVLFSAQAVYFILTLLFYTKGMLVDIVNVRNEVERHSLGFIFPLDFHGIFLSLCLSYMYIRKDKYFILDAILILFFNMVMYSVTYARMDFMTIIVAAILMLMVKQKWFENINDKLLLGISSGMTVLISVIMFICTTLYNENSAILMKLNRVLNNRLMIPHKVLMEDGYYPLFGKYMQWIGSGSVGHNPGNYNWIDCSVLKDTFDDGIVFVIFFMVVIILTYWNLIRSKQKPVFILFFVLMMNSMVEYHTFLRYFYPVFLMPAVMILHSNKELFFVKKNNIVNTE